MQTLSKRFNELFQFFLSIIFQTLHKLKKFLHVFPCQIVNPLFFYIIATFLMKILVVVPGLEVN